MNEYTQDALFAIDAVQTTGYAQPAQAEDASTVIEFDEPEAEAA